MVDNVNLNLVNPFTNEVLSAEQIAALDTDHNGIVDYDEWNAGQSVLQASADTEGASSVGESKVFDKLVADGDIKATAETQAELKEALASVADEYLENYFTTHSSMTSEEKAMVRSAVADVAKTFPDEYIKKNPNGPFDVKAAAIEMEIKIEEKIVEKKNLTSLNNNIIDGYKTNADDNWEALLKLLSSAMENDNISTKEYNQIKNKLVQYLMGSVLNGADNEEFFASLNKNYKNDENYKKIAGCINKIQTSSNPDDIKQAVVDLQAAITAFVNSCKQDDVVNSISAQQVKNTENKAKTAIAPAGDKWKEEQVKKGMSNEEVAQLDKFIADATAKFIASISESGEIDILTDQNMQTLFTNYLNTAYAELKAEQAKLNVEPSAIDKALDNLISVSDSANENKNISDAEKENIINAAVDLIFKQLLDGMKDIPFLQNLGADLGNVEKLMDDLKNATTADDIKAIQVQIKDALKEILNKYSGDQLVSAVNKTKPMTINDTQKSDIIFNSEIYADYESGKIEKGKLFFYKERTKALEDTQSYAKETLEKLSSSLKAQMQKELGDAYDESLVQECIDSAITDTIALFTQNVGGAKGFKLERRGGFFVQYSFNVKELVDTFIDKFNAEAKVKCANKNDPSQATYDKEDVMQDAGLTNDYGRNTTYKFNDRAQVIAEAKKTLERAAASLKASLAQQGCTLPSSTIDSIVEESMKETMSEYDFNNTARYENSKTGAVFIDNMRKDFYSNRFYSKELIDMFLDKVDTKIEEAKKKEKEPEKSE